MKTWFSGCIYCGILTQAPDDVCRSCSARLEMTRRARKRPVKLVKIRTSARSRAA